MLILDVSVLRSSIGRNAHCFRMAMRAFWRGAIHPQTLHGKRRREMGSRCPLLQGDPRAHTTFGRCHNALLRTQQTYWHLHVGVANEAVLPKC